ncbi:MAG: hypothetical protein LBQ89_09190 [Treponema sp.]|jgi:hypothetical protein|nr:hypothetical protein [Treponema sp.]
MSTKKYFLLFFVVLSLISYAAAPIYAFTTPDTAAILGNGPLFPAIYFTDTINNIKRTETSRPYWVNTKDELEAINRIAANQVSILLNNDILAYYGHPNSRNMGILGRHTMEELNNMLDELAAEYEAVSGGRKVRKAFYLIYGTVWPEGEIGIIGNETLTRYIEFGLENDILIFIDHQIGRYDPVDSLRRMLPWLRYPNVHLALDPEWRTTKPMVEIGSVTAEEINRAQQVMEDYIIENNIPGERFLVIHQFYHSMIRNRENVRSDFNRVRLVHCADGFGPPRVKRETYAYNARASNMPIKAFKLFYNLGIPGAGYDNPLMTPSEVYELNPRPYIIMYQ